MLKPMRRVSFDVYIRQDIFEFIEEVFENKNKFFFKGIYLKKDALIYLFYLFESLESYSFKDSNYENSEIHLSTTKLIKEFNASYRFYIDFMIHYKFIIKVKSYKVGSHTNVYRFSKTYSKHMPYKIFKILDSVLLKKINTNNIGKTEDKKQKNVKASRLRKHLTRGFNKNLDIDFNSCKSLMVDMNPLQYRSNFCTLFNFHYKRWDFSIKKETDNRLHTLLTRLNKKFLKHIRYENESLAEVDIKTSQPMFLYAVINVIFNNNEESDFKNKIEEKLGKVIMENVLKLKIDTSELIRFGDIVLNQDLYNFLSDNLIFKKADNKFIRYEFDKIRNSKKLVTYDNKRDLTKKIVMETLYSSPKNYNREVKQIKGLFPSIFNVVDFIKNSMEEENGFPIFLQQLEAEVLLDEIGGVIIKEKPDIIIFSKHDSLITTSKNIDFLKFYVEKELTSYLSLENVKLEIYHWE